VQADSLYPTLEQAAHMARQSPARALRECAARRAIIADYLRRDALGETIGRDAVADLLQVLTMVYTDHPDYAGSWT
jgi:Family of unknown function (DUF6221)